MTVDEIKTAIAGMSPTAVADASGVAVRAIYNINNGLVTPSRKTLDKLAAWLDGVKLPQTQQELEAITNRAFNDGVAWAHKRGL